MSQRDYRSMSQMPSHGSASMMGAANARESYQSEEADTRENFQMKGNPMMMRQGRMAGDPMMMRQGRMAGEYAPSGAGQMQQQQCHFPQAPPNRCYCQPAAFSSLDGRSYFRINDAYGNSRPCPSFY